MSEEFVRKVQEYLRRLKSAESSKEYLQCLSELRAYYEGAVDSETNPIWWSIGQTFIAIFHIAHSFEKISTLVESLSNRLSDLEKRVKRIEDELNFRERYR